MIEKRSDVPSSFIKSEVNNGLGNFDIYKDENGVYSFANTSSKSSLMFSKKLFKGSGRIDFDIKVDGTFNGASNQGIVFANSTNSITWNKQNESFYSLGRTKEGNIGLLDIYKGSLENQLSSGSLVANPMGDINKTYRISLIIDRDNNWNIKSYVNEIYAGTLCLSDKYDGEYIGLMSGINGSMVISNIQVNGVGIEIVNCFRQYVVSRGEFHVDKDIEGHPVFTSKGKKDNETFVIKNHELVDGDEIEFDFKSFNYDGSTGQGILLGCSSNADEPYSLGARALIGRLKNGKIGGIVINNNLDNVNKKTLNWKYGSELSSGVALQVMQDDTKTYHLKAIYHFIDSYSISVELYVDGIFGRHLKYNSVNNEFGKFIGFNSGLNGSIEISKIKINGNYFKEVI